MDTILVVCGAGASSTFLASRMRALASKRGLPVSARAGSSLDIDAQLATTRVLLVGPHLATEFATLADRARRDGVPAALLPATAFGPNGAADALDLALGLLAAPAN